MTELTGEAVATYTLAGEAVVTVTSGNNDRSFTFLVKRCEEDDWLYFVELLRGTDRTPDNTYIGYYHSIDRYLNLAKQWRERTSVAWPPAVRTARFFFKRLYDIPCNMHVFREDNTKRKRR